MSNLTLNVLVSYNDMKKIGNFSIWLTIGMWKTLYQRSVSPYKQ